VFPYPLTLAAAKLGVSTSLALSLWILHLRPIPKRWMNQFRHLVPVVFFNTLGLSLADFSLFSGTVFVNQTTRAAQSSFTIMWTNMPATIWGMIPLVMVFGGIYRATATDLSSTCFLTGMAANLSFTLRGVCSRRILWHKATPANNFGVITMLSFLFMAPVAYYLEGEQFRFFGSESEPFHVNVGI